MSYGLKDRKEYLEYVKWMNKNYNCLGAVLHPYYVKQFKKERDNG